MNYRIKDQVEFLKKDQRFNILHWYIFKRVLDFNIAGKDCYISNAAFAQETGKSESTIKRAIKLMIYNEVIYAKNKDSVKNGHVITRRLLFVKQSHLKLIQRNKSTNYNKHTDKKQNAYDAAIEELFNSE